MSDADYAPKRRPVLPRLVMALRRIPAVDFAFAKLGALLRRRTNVEQMVASEVVAPVSEGATDAVEPDVVEREPVATGTTHTNTVEAQPALADSVASDAVETEAAETSAEAIEVVETPEAQSTLDEGDARGADDIASPGATDECRSDEAGEPVSIAPGPEEPVAIDPIEIDAVEPAPVEVEAAASESFETPAIAPDAVASTTAATDDIAPPEARPDAHDEQELETAEAELPVADLAATDPVEIATSETPPTALDAAETEIVEIPVMEEAPVGTAAIAADDVTPLAATEAAVAAVPAAKADEPLDREALIRRRWKETGIMMWRGAGQSTLCIQGSAALLPPKPGETMPQYDRLEFRLIDGLIVCEGFVLDPPAPLKNRTFARAA